MPGGQLIVVSIETDPNQKWRAEGTAFAVQELSVSLHEGVTLRVETPDDARVPVLVPGSSFEVVDGSRPASWVVSDLADQSFDLGPPEWQEVGFWERFFDREPEALAIYEEFRTVLPGAVEPAVLEPYTTARTIKVLAEGEVPVGSVGVILGVTSEPVLAYELEIVDDDGKSLFSGEVDPSMIEPVV